MWRYALARGMVVLVASVNLKVLVRWDYEEACSSSFLLIGVMLWGDPNDLGCTVPFLRSRC